MLLDPRNGEAFDLSVTRVASRTWVLASLPRTGSTLLCRVLATTGGAGSPKEYLNPMQLRDWQARLAPSRAVRLQHRLLVGPMVSLAGRGRWDERRLQAYLDRVRARRTGSEGWFGLKIHYHHFHQWFLSRGWPVDRLLAPERWVTLRRSDRVAQAVSWARALQTGRWAAHQRGWLPPRYRPRQIERLIARIEADEAAWDAYFVAQGIAPLRLTYEQVTGDLGGTARSVLRFLGHPDADHVEVARADIVRQADEQSATWAARFRSTHPSSGAA